MVSLRCPYLFFFLVKLKPTVSLPVFFKFETYGVPTFFGGVMLIDKKIGTLVMLSGWDLLKSAFNHALFLEAVVGYQSTWCSQECWVSFCFNLSYLKEQVFFCTDLTIYLTDFFVVIWLKVIFSHTYDLQRQYQDEHPGKFALHRLPRGKAVSFGNSCFLSFW